MQRGGSLWPHMDFSQREKQNCLTDEWGMVEDRSGLGKRGVGEDRVYRENMGKEDCNREQLGGWKPSAVEIC